MSRCPDLARFGRIDIAKASFVSYFGSMNTLRIILMIGLLTVSAALTAPAQQAAQTHYTQGRKAFLDGDYNTAQQKFLDALAINPKHAPSIAMLDKVRAAMPRVNAQLQAYSNLIIDEVKFDNANFKSVLEYLRQQAVKKSNGRVQPNFVVKAPDPEEFGNRRISLRLSKVPFLEVLRYACGLADAEFVMEKYAIVVRPLGQAGQQNAPAPEEG